MPTTPITNSVTGESIVGTEPQLLQQVDPGWRHRLNLFTGRALSDVSLNSEQTYRSGLFTTLGQSVTAGTLKGLVLTMDTSFADPLLSVTPGYGIAANGEDVRLLSALKTKLSSLVVIDPSTIPTQAGVTEKSEMQLIDFLADATKRKFAGILILQPVVAQVSGQTMDTGTGPIEVSGNLGASCDQDPQEYAFEDWQIADGVRLVFYPWPDGVPALPLPDPTVQPATLRNRLAYTIFEAEALLGPDDSLPWTMLGVPVALIAFDPANSWKPLFVDCSSVVRAGGLPRRRNVFPAQPPPTLNWQANTFVAQGEIIVDANNNVQIVSKSGKTGPAAPAWLTAFGQVTTESTGAAWTNNGPASWKPTTSYTAGQFIFDPNGNMQHVQTAGTSGGTQPAWSSVYLPTFDGSITWVNNGTGNPPIVQPGLAQARVAQLSEQLGQIMSQSIKFNTLADNFATLPPSGILPSAAVDFVKKIGLWFPPNWSLTAAPVHLEELETVLQTGMTEALLEAETSAPTDLTLLEPVEILVPLPDAVYDPNILVTEKVAPVFQQEVNKATQARNVTLKRLKTVKQELNALFVALGPNVPTNPNLLDADAGLTPQEIQGRNAPPPYLPAPTESFGTFLQSTWLAQTQYAVDQFIIDSNGSIQVVQAAGKSGGTQPMWNTTRGQTTNDNNAITWLNNGPWIWQANTAYIAGQLVIDSNGSMQIVKSGGTSASSQPTWNRNPQQTTLDGIIWAPNGNAQWQPDNQYAAGQVIFDSNGNIQIVQNAGISGDSAPVWNKNSGQTTLDSAVIWNNLGRSLWQPNTSYSAGQAIVDSNGDIQIAQIGGTSGATQPAWRERPSSSATSGPTGDAELFNTMDAAITWTNNGPLIWQPNATYSNGQIIVDSNGNLQLAGVVAGTTGKSGATPPTWNTTPGQTTPDGGISWTYLAFKSKDFLQLQAAATQPPYTITYSEYQQPSQTIPLINTNDLADLQNNGLQHFINRLNAKISQANDILDTGFLTVQTDIYRYRQNVLGSTAASTLATSPLLANIAAGETANATAANLQAYINSVVPSPTTGPQGPTYGPPVMQPVNDSVIFSNLQTSSAASSLNLAAQSFRARAIAAAVSPVKTTGPAVSLTKFSATQGIASAIATSAPPASSTSALVKGAATVKAGSVAASVAHMVQTPQPSPVQIVIPGQNANATSTDITRQSPLTGAQLNIRTFTIAERLQQSPSQEAMFYSINNRLGFIQLLEMIENVLEITASDLPILVDEPPKTPPPAGQPPNPVLTQTHTFSEWLNKDKQGPLMLQIQSPVLFKDAPEATFFSVGVRILEQHAMLLRALEARVQQYVDFVGLCTTTLNNIQNDIQQAQILIAQLQNNLLQDRQNVAFTTALLNDEISRVNSVNAQRLQVLRDSVQLVAYTRARTLEPTDTTPSRQLVPANIANPVPACVQQSVSIPPELREIIGLLREAPVIWLPSVSSLMNRLERPILLQQLALSLQARAAMQLQLPLLPSSAAGEPGVYAPAISSVYGANQQVFRGFQSQRAAFQPGALTSFSWNLQVAAIQSIAAVNDLIAAEAVHTEVSNATSRLIQQICGVATCLYTRVSVALPIYRLAWAEYLRGAGLSVQLQSLAVLPNWNEQSYIDRQQMQLLVDWLFQQIDTGIPAATAFMSDVVRTAILLASDVPIDNIIPGSIIVRTQPAVGGVVSLNLPSERIASGMYVQLYSGATLAARAVVSDIDAQTVSATVTDLYSPGVYLETSDTAHFTAQSPQAVALRPFLMQS